MADNSMAAIGERLRTQDNRITSHPIFIVQQRRKVYVGVCCTKVWEFVTACFTEAGAQAYIDCNGHNLHEPRIYVESAWRNEEWQAVRSELMQR